MYALNYTKVSKISKIIIINIAVAVFLILLLELPVRLFETSGGIKLFSDRTDVIRGRPFVAENEEMGFLLVPNYHSSDININSSGFRGRDFNVDRKEDYVILAIGGSTTFGWTLDDQDTYPQQLENILRSNKLIKKADLNISVINAGIPSFTSTQQKLYLNKILKEIKPDMVLVMTGINDYYYSMLANWYPEVLLLRTPPAWMSFLRENSALYRLILRKSAMPEELINVFNEDALELFRSNIQEMIEICATNNIDIVAIAPPFNVSTYTDKGFSPFNEVIHKGEFITSSQKRFWDSQVHLFSKKKLNSIDHSMSVTNNTDKHYFLDHCHLTQEGNRLLVRDVSHQLVKILLKQSSQLSSPKIRKIVFSKPLPEEVKETGLSIQEEWGRWSNAKTVTIDLQEMLPRKFTLTLEAHSFRQLNAPFILTIGDSTLDFILKDNEITHTTLKLNNVKDEKYTISITVPNPVSPKSLSLSDDTRELGIGIRSILIEPL